MWVGSVGCVGSVGSVWSVVCVGSVRCVAACASSVGRRLVGAVASSDSDRRAGGHSLYCLQIGLRSLSNYLKDNCCFCHSRVEMHHSLLLSANWTKIIVAFVTLYACTTLNYCLQIGLS